MKHRSILFAVAMILMLPQASKAQNGTIAMNGTLDSNNVYTYAPINWRFEIPEYYFSTKDQDADSVNMLKNDPNELTRLLQIGKDKRNILYARLVPLALYDQGVGGYDKFWETFARVQYQQAVDFGDKPDTSTKIETIHGKQFRRFMMTVKDSKGKLVDYMCLYSYKIDGKDLVVEILANNKEDSKLLTDAFKASVAGLKD